MLTGVTDVSILAVNIVTMLGLGLAIDYALFIVSRYREELALRPRDEDATVERSQIRSAVIATMDTAGRTVAVSGLVVAVALTSLLFFPQVFLRSMGLGGISAVLVAMGASLTLLPALLSVLGRRIDALRLPRRRQRGRQSAPPPLRGDVGWQIRGMAVVEGQRGMGLGTQILSALVEHVARNGGGLMWCRARVLAVSLYERSGFKAHGDPVEDEVAGLQVLMARVVTALDL